jgi:hypothetical protein
MRQRQMGRRERWLLRLTVSLYAAGFVSCMILPLMVGLLLFGALGLSGMILADRWSSRYEQTSRA